MKNKQTAQIFLHNVCDIILFPFALTWEAIKIVFTYKPSPEDCLWDQAFGGSEDEDD